LSRFPLDAARAFVKSAGDAGCAGPDAYSPEPRHHPMAEGKLLSSLRRLLDVGALSTTDFASEVEASVSRLERANLVHASNEAAWGLGFEWRGTSATEPFLITTSIVARGLLDANLPTANDLRDRTLRWLNAAPSRFGVPFDALTLPAFSPHLREPVCNTIAAWAGVLWRTGERRIAADAFRAILARHHIGYGWTYGGQSTRVDLLHQMYIIGALEEIDDPEVVTRDRLSNLAIDCIGALGMPGSLFDKADILSLAEAKEAAGRASSVWIRNLDNSRAIVVYRDPPRPWSLGEAIAVCSRLALRGGDSTFWTTMAIRLGDLAKRRIESHIEWRSWPRDVTHMAEGLASLAMLKRSLRLNRAAPHDEPDVKPAETVKHS
jgi:hypothetical protein